MTSRETLNRSVSLKVLEQLGDPEGDAYVPVIRDNVAQRNRLFGYDVVEPIAGLTTQMERVLMPARNGHRLCRRGSGIVTLIARL